MSGLISLAIIAAAIGVYLLHYLVSSRKARAKLNEARERGLSEEPVTLHPRIDAAACIGSGACVKACPQLDVLGLVSGRGSLINASHCMGHGACAAACPVGAITLVFGTETRGVEIPWLTTDFETNIKGVFIAGELGGMGLIRNAIIQGSQAAAYIACSLKGAPKRNGVLDAIIVGAGPAGISASLTALKNGLSFATIEQGDIGGTVLQYPRKKIVMTHPVDLPMYGRMRLRETTKEALLELWRGVIGQTGLNIRTGERMTGLAREGDIFRVTTDKGSYAARNVVLAIGRRGTPRKLGVPGEDLPKVAYSLLEPGQHKGEEILVVGGGDSALEASLALANAGARVTLSYRKAGFTRAKAANRARLDKASAEGRVSVLLESNLTEIMEKTVALEQGGMRSEAPNDFVYILAGGESPNDLLKSIGVQLDMKFGSAAFRSSR